MAASETGDSSLQAQIISKALESLRNKEGFDELIISRLSALVDKGKMNEPEEILEVLGTPTGDDNETA